MRPESLPHIGINALLLANNQQNYRSAGIHHYMDGLLPEIVKADDLRYSIFLSDGKPHVNGTARLVKTGANKAKPLGRVLWEQFSQPRLVNQMQLDLLHSLAFVSPMLSRVPSIVTVYDLSFLHFPQRFKTVNRNYLRIFTRLSCKRAEKVVAISEYTRQDVIRQYGIAPEKVEVVYPGLDPTFLQHPIFNTDRNRAFSPKHNSATQDSARVPNSSRVEYHNAIAEFRQRKGLPERYVLYLGTIEPRKNLSTLITAFARLRPEGIKLVCAGGRGWLYEDVFNTVNELRLQRDVIFPGYVPREELPLLYSAAEAFVYPSSFEGFGLSVLEALACGVPTITTQASSLPEVVGNAALLVEPENSEALSDCLNSLLTSPAQQAELRQAGPLQAEKFRWQTSGEQMVNIYRQVLRQSQPHSEAVYALAE
ncbi:MAG TPA: glycosyltransferase family 1 protein [Anaerolineales bacterium]|nr:glycosyltransferase family 1 protein [Anaerolineales bacterium]